MTNPATTFNSDFVCFAGDDVTPVFTVVDSTGAAIDISAATAIVWFCERDADSAAALSLTKAAGQITFVTNGTDGKFQVALSAANTTALDSGFYQHYGRVTLAGKTVTVNAGRMKVGPKPTWTYDASRVATVPLYQVRRLLGDVIYEDQQLSDSEVAFALTQRSTIEGAAADCARYLAGQYSRKPDVTSPGGITTNYGEQAKKYLALARDLDNQAVRRGAGGIAYAGGISISDKTSVQADADRVQPSFNLGMMDNTIPIGQIGNETPTLPMGGTAPS